MTTVAWCGGIIASDSQVNSGNLTMGSSRRKISAAKHKKEWWFCGAAGDAGVCETLLAKFDTAGSIEKFVKWFYTLELKDNDSPAVCFYVRANGKSVVFLNRKDDPVEEICKYYAIGSGMELALGALAAGATAIDAVNIACKHDVKSSLPAVWYDQYGNFRKLDAAL